MSRRFFLERHRLRHAHEELNHLITEEKHHSSSNNGSSKDQPSPQQATPSPPIASSTTTASVSTPPTPIPSANNSAALSSSSSAALQSSSSSSSSSSADKTSSAKRQAVYRDLADMLKCFEAWYKSEQLANELPEKESLPPHISPVNVSSLIDIVQKSVNQQQQQPS